MNPRFSSALALLLGLAPLTGRAAELYQEKFDALPAAAANVPGFSLVEDDAAHGKALKIERVDKIHQCIRIPLQVAGQEKISLAFDYKGAGYFFLLNGEKQQLLGGGISKEGKVNVIAEKQNKWVFTGLYVQPAEWVRLTFNLDFTAKSFTVLVNGKEGEKEAGPFALAAEGAPALLQFGNALPVGNVSLLDNILIQSGAPGQNAAGGLTLLRQDFEKMTPEIKNGGADFTLEAAPEKAADWHNSLKIARNSKVHNAVNFRFRRILPAGSDFTVSFDYKGIGYVFVQDARKKQLGGVVFTPKLRIITGDQNKQQTTAAANDTAVWAHYDITFRMTAGNYTVKRTAADGTTAECGPFEFAAKTAPVQLQFGNSLPVGNVSWLDNLHVEAIPAAQK